jgi:O-succinylbenzoic acid--CoA ligase
MFRTLIENQTIRINGILYNSEDIKSGKAINEGVPFELNDYLNKWFDDSEYIPITTSGSTGSPKTMVVLKKSMIRSAELSCNYFQLKENDKVLLCLSMNYIAAKMLVVRSLVAGLDLYPVEPSGNPLKDTNVSFDFISMVPMQVHNTLLSETETKKLKEVKNLLIGGQNVDASLESKLKSFPNKIYVSYGMAETLSHIGLRKINGSDASDSYTLLPGISVTLSDRETLVIEAPEICPDKIITNDLAKINSAGTFEILGRTDNIINSGGLKIQIEEIESMLSDVIKTKYAITSLPDAKFGEIVVLVTEDEINDDNIFDGIPNKFRPKKIIKIDKIPLTVSNKINRSELKKIVFQKSF